MGDVGTDGDGDEIVFARPLDRLRAFTPRPVADVAPHHASLPRASVLVPLFERRGCGGGGGGCDGHRNLHVLLTRRPNTLRTHAGEVCFPGGRQDPEDGGDDVTTALRETQEEVGIPPDAVEVLCHLETVESVGGLCVTPVVGLVDPPSAAEPGGLTLSQDEVEAAFAVPLSYFANETNCASKREVEWSGGTFVMRTYFYKAPECGRTFKIWGLTAHVAYEVARIARVGDAPDCAGHAAGHSEDGGAVTAITKATCVYEKSLADGGDDNRPRNGLSGYLWRLEGDRHSPGTVSSSSRRRPFWARRFFVVSFGGAGATAARATLHQYDGERQAKRRCGTATKKNRLPLLDCEVVVIATTTTTVPEPSSSASSMGTGKGKAPKEGGTVVGGLGYEFVVSALGGRVRWRLAARTDEERARWAEALRGRSGGDG